MYTFYFLKSMTLKKIMFQKLVFTDLNACILQYIKGDMQFCEHEFPEMKQ